MIARNKEQLEVVAAEIVAAGGSCATISCDLTSSDQINKAINQIQKDDLSQPAILINNAGFGGPFHTTDELGETEWDQVFNTNIKAPFLFCKRLLPAMKANNFGRIINISSIYGTVGGSHSSAYAASKHALVGYTKSLAIEWGAYNITSNIISPGFVDTAMGAVDEAYQKSAMQHIPLQRQATPGEIARLALFLIQKESGYINGANLVVDGGLSAGFRFL